MAKLNGFNVHHEPESSLEDVQKAIVGQLKEWLDRAKNGEFISVVLIGGSTSDGRTMSAYACAESPSAAIGRLWETGNRMIESKEEG